MGRRKRLISGRNQFATCGSLLVRSRCSLRFKRSTHWCCTSGAISITVISCRMTNLCLSGQLLLDRVSSSCGSTLSYGSSGQLSCQFATNRKGRRPEVSPLTVRKREDTIVMRTTGVNRIRNHRIVS